MDNKQAALELGTKPVGQLLWRHRGHVGVESLQYH